MFRPAKWFVLSVLFAAVAAASYGNEDERKRSFEIDKKNGVFLKDGFPFRYISGTIHYFRVRPEDWQDRLKKLRHAGCNVVETYIEWNSHEPESGRYDFEDGLNLFKFLDIALQEDLLVILRPGPFIDAERDMGGLPYWLLRENVDVQLRTMDESFLRYVRRWYRVLFPLLRPFLYSNGGPVIMVQVENEYGSYHACDFYYTGVLRDLTTALLGDEVALFTTDGCATSYLKCGKVADVYATVDFGPGSNVESAFASQRAFEPRGPLINSEFYPGWLDHWGQPHEKVDSERVASTLDEMLAMNASVNIYVFHGGTNFGLSAGSNINGKFMACPTSYDYDAPLSEAGDPTEKYFAIRNVTQKYVDLPPGPVPGPSPKEAYGDVEMSLKAGLFELVDELESVHNDWPLTFEELSVFNGIVIYSTVIPCMIPDPARLLVDEIHDRGYVFVDETAAGIVSREQEAYELPIFARPNQTLSIVAESQGRICYGSKINDFKGITTNVTLGPLQLQGWKMTPIPLLNSTQLRWAFDLLYQKNLPHLHQSNFDGMAFYEGFFDIPSQPSDTFLNVQGWTKGYAWVNDFLLGRYWPAVGPQMTLYIPKSLLQQGRNSLLLLELEASPCDGKTPQRSCKASLDDTHNVDGPTPQW